MRWTARFYYALGSQVSVRSAFERAQQVLRVDPDLKVKASAVAWTRLLVALAHLDEDMFVLFGQHAARSKTVVLKKMDDSGLSQGID